MRDKPLNYENITEADAKEAGIKFELMKEWFKVNGQISTWLKNNSMDAKNDGDGFWKYQGYCFYLNFINNDYLQFNVVKGDDEMLTMRHTGNVRILLHCLVSVIAKPATKN